MAYRQAMGEFAKAVSWKIVEQMALVKKRRIKSIPLPIWLGPGKSLHRNFGSRPALQQKQSMMCVDLNFKLLSSLGPPYQHQRIWLNMFENKELSTQAGASRISMSSKESVNIVLRRGQYKHWSGYLSCGSNIVPQRLILSKLVITVSYFGPLSKKPFYTMFFALFLLTLTSLIRRDIALTVTEPSGSTTWHAHSPNLVQWQSVQTDPESVEVRLVNNNPAVFPTGFTRSIKDGINTADNKFNVDQLQGIKPGKGYQVNIMSSAGTILAQSAQFAINGTSEANTTASAVHTSSAPLPQQTAPPPVNASASASSDAPALRTAPAYGAATCIAFILALVATIAV
ncbi:hypothetical protein O181_070156 [Austropuccinia psidii MF-1]|uniref:Yeast cell wall synthesis Kre9/Knh1-like N-terminal domain-containing protein n=1 Tax=Austropuccinia psidii MF-1 TaxID=1389203 RepID=A0A9Q3I5F3_9BASI|nr:hypothetical protein [Austropuccinia psidii MF-1]